MDAAIEAAKRHTDRKQGLAAAMNTVSQLTNKARGARKTGAPVGGTTKNTADEDINQQLEALKKAQTN